MDNKQNLPGHATGDNEVEVVVRVGSNVGYLYRVDKGEVKLLALVSAESKQQNTHHKDDEDIAGKEYLHVILEAKNKERIFERSRGEGDTTKEIDQVVPQSVKSKKIVLERIPGVYEDLDSFFDKNADNLHEYTGHEKEKLPASDNKAIISSLLREQLESLFPEKDFEDFKITTYRVGNYRAESNSLTGFLGKTTVRGWIWTLAILTAIVFVFLIYYFRILQKIADRVRRFFFGG